MIWKQSSLLALAVMSANASPALVARAGQWIVGLEPIQAVITQDDAGAFSFQCQTNGQTVVTASKIGFSTSLGDVGPQFQSCTALEQTEELVVYTTPVGRTTSRSATYRTQSFQCQTTDAKHIQLDIRVGRDGCGFRTKVPDGQYQVTAESSSWTFAQNGATFLMDDPENTSYEGEWIQSDVATGLSDSRRVMMPYLADVGSVASDQWVLLIEGDIDGRWQGSQLSHSDGSLNYTFYLAEGGVVEVQKAVFTPWRIAVVGDLPTLYKSHFDQDNHEPTNVTDLSWIKPGNVAWHWLPEPDAVHNLTRLEEYVDVAALEKWPFVLIDEGWSEDTVTKLVNYAELQGIGVIIWYPSNQWNSTSDIVTHIADMKSWGVKGAKLDFFLSDVQAMHAQQDSILSQMAEAQLMVNFHGCPPPRGMQRQWPHLMTVEAIKGDEHENSAFRHTVIPLTRGLVGSMDFTPSLYTAAGISYSDERQRQQLEQCSVGCGLAKAIVFESGWQHPGERPEVIRSYPLAVRMYKELPSSWQDSDLLSGSYPGKAIVVGRRSDTLNRHYFAGVFNGAEQTFDLKPTNLPTGKTFVLDVVHDSPGNDTDRTAIDRTIHTDVDSGSSISIPIKSNGGFTAIACETAGADGGCLFEA
ncbi:glycoside hydrolase family 97 [Fusarium tjaetaba]|uniref:alpha-galactosidase n=1 Tax=Fusarium tjaetaba TaxID=1567544 RepID=A0A8H5V838_9HYPO|nr:glycoside hydrolase family 97 [Fusarium tjaetaba]KAF5614627.1 glycoside hydrolase family 97 [Fusarium tjaetaba]